MTAGESGAKRATRSAIGCDPDNVFHLNNNIAPSGN
jgi:hypothetical protein